MLVETQINYLDPLDLTNSTEIHRIVESFWHFLGCFFNMLGDAQILLTFFQIHECNIMNTYITIQYNI